MARIQRHTIYIRCRPPELWAALCEAQATRMYYYDALVESSFEPGAAICYFVEPDRDTADHSRLTVIAGEIIAVERERALVHSFRFCDLDEPASKVGWTLTDHDAPGVMRVEVEHDELVEGSETLARISQGWPVILSGLKTWLETGTALNVVGGSPPDEAAQDAAQT